MTARLIPTFLLSLALASPLSAFSVFVMDGDTGQPLEGATIVLHLKMANGVVGDMRQVITDEVLPSPQTNAQGRYTVPLARYRQFDPVRDRIYDVTVRFDGGGRTETHYWYQENPNLPPGKISIPSNLRRPELNATSYTRGPQRVGGYLDSDTLYVTTYAIGTGKFPHAGLNDNNFDGDTIWIDGREVPNYDRIDPDSDGDGIPDWEDHEQFRDIEIRRPVEYGYPPRDPIADRNQVRVLTWENVGPGTFAGERAIMTVNGVEFAFRWCPPGSFLMGWPSVETGGYQTNNWIQNFREKPETFVTLTRGFWMGETEITNAQWQAVMGDNRFQDGGADLPVVSVTWHQATEFTGRMAERARMTVTLPTEAQWEYACRAGTDSFYFFGDGADELSRFAWFSSNSGGSPKPVRGKLPNPWGLYDMLGNALEWTSNWGHPHPGGNVTDYAGSPHQGQARARIARGGSWSDGPLSMHSAHRHFVTPTHSGAGLRVVVRASR